MPEVRLHPRSTVHTRTVQTRRVEFDFADVDAAHDRRHRHYWDHDLIESHLIATLSALIPSGERFVIRSVRSYRGQMDEPTLKAQATAFIGQETMHQREHDRFNEALARLGYPTGLIDQVAEATFGLLARLPRRTRIAMTAAIEHYTAVLAERTLADGWLDRWELDPSVRSFFGWHLVEELEHKAVAFDAMQSVGVTEQERIATMLALTILLSPAVVVALALSLSTDRGSRNPRTVLRSLMRLRRGVFSRQRLVRDLIAYDGPHFHPDERDVQPLLEHWRVELAAPLEEARSRARSA